MTLQPAPYSSEEWRVLLEQLPGRDLLQERHARFMRTNFAGLSLADLERAFHENYLLFPIGHVSLTGMKNDQRVLYRARWIDVAKENVNNVVTHSYPPDSFTPLGRANIQGHPVFYASPSPLTALIEIGLDGYKHDKSLFIGRWKYTTDEPWIRHPMLPGSAPQTFMQKYNEEMQDAARYSLALDGAGRIEDLVFLNDCFSELFLSENYGASSWIAHTLLYRLKFGDEVQYPSIQRRKGSLCSAIKPSAIDTGQLALESVLVLDVIHAEYSAPNFDLKATSFMLGTPTDGTIDWAEAGQEQLNDFFPELASGVLSLSEKKVERLRKTDGSILAGLARLSPFLEVDKPSEPLNGVFRQTHHFEIGISPYGATGNMSDRGVQLSLAVSLQAGGKALCALKYTCRYVVRLPPDAENENFLPLIHDTVAGYNESVAEKAEKEGWFSAALLVKEDSFDPAVVLAVFADSWQQNQ